MSDYINRTITIKLTDKGDGRVDISTESEPPLELGQRMSPALSMSKMFLELVGKEYEPTPEEEGKPCENS